MSPGTRRSAAIAFDDRRGRDSLIGSSYHDAPPCNVSTTVPDLDIPFNDLSRYEPTVARRIRAATSRVVSSGPYVLGPEVEKFETEFAAYCGRRHCVAVGNGTDAIELALRAVGVEAGARVGTVANAGMYASVAALAIGATPVYVDVDSADHNLCPTKLSDDVLSTLDALVVTHLYGRMANMPAIHEYAKRHSVPIIEDCAQAHGASLGGRPAGSWGAAGCFSFYPTKNLGALGDAGAVVSSDDEIAQKIRLLRQYGWRSTRHHCGWRRTQQQDGRDSGSRSARQAAGTRSLERFAPRNLRVLRRRDQPDEPGATRSARRPRIGCSAPLRRDVGESTGSCFKVGCRGDIDTSPLPTAGPQTERGGGAFRNWIDAAKYRMAVRKSVESSMFPNDDGPGDHLRYRSSHK